MSPFTSIEENISLFTDIFNNFERNCVIFANIDTFCFKSFADNFLGLSPSSELGSGSGRHIWGFTSAIIAARMESNAFNAGIQFCKFNWVLKVCDQKWKSGMEKISLKLAYLFIWRNIWWIIWWYDFDYGFLRCFADCRHKWCYGRVVAYDVLLLSNFHVFFDSSGNQRRGPWMWPYSSCSHSLSISSITTGLLTFLIRKLWRQVQSHFPSCD